MRASLLALLASGCRPAEVDPPEGTETDADADTDTDTDADTDADTDTEPPAPTGSEGGSGFGAAVAFVGETLYIGAPHGETGAVFSWADDTLAEVVSGSGRTGSALAGGDALLIGAPLMDDGAGGVLDAAGAAVVKGTGSTGLAVAWAEGWVVAGATGWVSASDSTTTPHRPTALAARSDGSTWQIGTGMAWGETALQVGDLTLPRPADRDEAGYALAAGDVDGDGEAEWILGAPGSSTVYVLSPDDLSIEATLTGEGRFGAALAVGPLGDGVGLLIGSPMAGADLQGAAALYTGGDLTKPAAIFTGEDAGDLLGFSVALREGVVALGAPGGAETPGRVALRTDW